MKKLKEYKEIIIVVLVLILGAFCWFEIMPMQINKKCAEYAQKLACDKNDGGCEKEKYDFRFKKCLSEYGLNK